MSIVRDRDRNYWSVEAKPSGTYRVLCLGDSLIYGSGVQPDETLPACLEKTLNRAIWNGHVEVINGGVSGFSLYDDWHSFLHHGYAYQPDLVAITICDNDAQLFSVTSLQKAGINIAYEDHAEESWHPDGIHFPHFRAELENISRQMKTHGIPVVLAFYLIHDPPYLAKLVSLLEKVCAELEIEFVDLSADFTGQDSSAHHPELRASEADGHPSGHAHSIAARRLARFVKKNGHLDTLTAETPDENGLYDRLTQNALEMRRLGYRDEYLFHNLGETLRARRSGKPRLKLPGEQLIDDLSFNGRITDLNEVSVWHRQLLYREAYARATQDVGDEFYFLSDTAAGRVIWISKALFALGNELGGKATQAVDFFGPQKDKPDPTLLAEIPAQLESWSTATQKCRDILNQPAKYQSRIDTSLLSGFVSSFEKRKQEVAQTVDVYLSEYKSLLVSIYNLYSDFGRLYQQHAATADAATLNSFGGLIKALSELMQYASRGKDLLRLEQFVEPSPDGLARPVTTCQLTVKSSSSEPFTVWVQTRALVPEHRPVADMKWVTCDGESHVYTFEFPLFCLGRLRLALNPRSEATIMETVLFNSPDRKVRVPLTEQSGPNAGEFASPTILLAP